MSRQPYRPDGTVPPARRHQEPGQDFKWIGKSMNRVEDKRLLLGKGQFIADVMLPNMTHAALLRSPHAHARIVSIDVSKALALPGVVAVVTGQDIKDSVGPSVSFANPPVEQRVIPWDKVRHVGETVAAVVAEDRHTAEDALELIDVVYELLPVAADLEAAVTQTGDGVLHPGRGNTNVASDRTFTFGPVDEDFAQAELVIKRRIRWNRQAAMPIETCGAVAEFDAATGRFRVHSNTNMYNYVGWLCAAALHVPSTHLTIVPTMVGGSFGSKHFLHKTIIMIAALARIVGRPVKFIEDRHDTFANNDGHGVDRVYDAQLALGRDGKFLSLRYRVVDDYGAYFQFGLGTNGNSFAQLIGPYQINSVQAHIVGVLTNKCQQGAYRGFGADVHNFMLERMVDAAARQIGMDPVEIRRRNLITADQFPYVIPTGNLYDSGDYHKVLDKALTMFDYDAWRHIQAQARAQGKHIGIGVVSCQARSVYSATEFWALDPADQPGFHLTSSPESLFLKIDPTGQVMVRINAPHWGNSPETMVTQIVAENLTLDPSQIVVTYADTDAGFNAAGPGGSRYTVMIAGAAVKACKTLRTKLFRLAAHMLDCSPDALECVGGMVRLSADPAQGKSIAELALAAHYFRLNFPDEDGFESGLETTAVYDHPLTTLPPADRKHLGIFYPIMGHMVHAVAVKVDAATGKVKILRYVAVQDSGTVVNPATLLGQIIGGTAQGIGGALYERLRYDHDGQLLTTSYGDYAIPSVYEVPLDIQVAHVETPSPYTEYGIKGGGEAGRFAAPPVLAQAVQDALGIEILETPFDAQTLAGLMRERLKV